MQLLTIVHQQDCGPGIFQEVIDAARAAGELSADCWCPAEQPAPPAPAGVYDAILICGGSANPPQEDRYPWLKAEKALLGEALARGTAMLGICLGAELIAEAAGTRTHPAPAPEIGWYPVKLTPAAASDPLFCALPPKAPGGATDPAPGANADPATFEALEWHSYEVPLPSGATPLAHSDRMLQAYRIGDSVWGVQFHPEVTAADFQLWIDDIPNDPSWPRAGRDAAELLAETEVKLEQWNRFGRALAERFLNFAAGR